MPPCLKPFRSCPAHWENCALARFPKTVWRAARVKDELRANLICKLQRREELFPGIVGYEDSVVPQVVNAILSRHNFILLGLARPGKNAADPHADHAARSVAAVRRRMRDSRQSVRADLPALQAADRGEGRCDADRLADRGRPYVEKLATPDVTIADMIGDIDPIKAARRGQDISDELTVHYGLMPRANRGIFAINELPDLAGKIQVGLFNIMQEGDVQIKGYPVRLPLDLLLVFTANPEDYTARGKIITPLKDRIGSEIRTHYPATLEHGIEITRAEAWMDRQAGIEVRAAELHRRDHRAAGVFGAGRQARRQALRRFAAAADFGDGERGFECRAARDSRTARRWRCRACSISTPRCPRSPGKIELEYEGELKGGDAVSRELIRAAVGKVFNRYFEGVNMQPVVQWFDHRRQSETGRGREFGGRGAASSTAFRA